MQTENFSNLPKSWQVKTLGECLDYEQPTKYIVKSTKYNDSYKTPVLTAGKSFILGYTDESDGIFTQTPVIIFDDFTTDTKFVDFKFKVKSSAMKILHSKENADIKFLYYLMQTIRHRSDTHKRYWISEYAKIKIPLPPLDIQKRIVSKLDEAFARIDNGTKHLKSAQNNLTKYKQSLLKSAFNGILFCHTEALQKAEVSQKSTNRDSSLTAFAQNDNKGNHRDISLSTKAQYDNNGETPNLPQGWIIKTLGEIAQTTSGGTPSRKNLDFWNGNIKWLKSGELNDGYIDEVEETITQSGLENSSAKIFSKGTLLIALYGATIGKLGILNLETSTNQAICAIVPNNELDTKYLFHFLFSIRNKMIKDAFGGAQSNISQTYLKQIKIPLPPLQTQKQIVEILEKHFSSADKTGAFIDSALKNAKQLKSSLLKSAFMGKLI